MESKPRGMTRITRIRETIMNAHAFLAAKPSPTIIRRLLCTSVVLMVVVYTVMTIVYLASGDRVDMLSSQLSFSATFLRWQYSQMSADGLVMYGIAQQIDYIFMPLYGIFSFSACVTLARNFPPRTRWQVVGFFLAMLGIVGACCDAVENAFIFLMLGSYPAIPQWQAAGHSTFALVKWCILVAIIAWLIGAFLHRRELRRT